MEDLLGSLGPQINAMMSRALSLEKKRPESSNLLLENEDVAAILELTKEKFSGQIVAGTKKYILAVYKSGNLSRDDIIYIVA
jgi:hypothetical protein